MDKKWCCRGLIEWAAMTPQQRREKAAEWAKRGLTNGAIAARLGVSTTTVRRWLNPAYAAYCRRVTAAHRRANPEKRKLWDTVPCPSCKKQRVEPGVEACRACQREAREMRWAEIEKLWNDENLTARAIAQLTGRTLSAVEGDTARMRKAGWKLRPRTWSETAKLNAALVHEGNL